MHKELISFLFKELLQIKRKDKPSKKLNINRKTWLIKIWKDAQLQLQLKRYKSKEADIIFHIGDYHRSEQLVLYKVAKLGGNRPFLALLMGRQIGIISSQDNWQYHSKWKHTTSRLCDLTSRIVSVNACQPESTKKATIVECGGFIAHPRKIGCTPQKTVRCLGREAHF